MDMNPSTGRGQGTSVSILLCFLMIFLGISASMGGLNDAEIVGFAEQSDVHHVILPLYIGCNLYADSGAAA